MRQLVVIVALAGVALAMPQGFAPPASDDTFTKILSFESYHDGSNFGHELLQEDGTSAGQKFGPDGNLYGFYSYIQEDGNRVRVLWRAGKDVGYEVIGVEGLNADNLGNLRATISSNPQPTHAPARPRPSTTFRPQPTHAPVVRPRPTTTHVPVVHRPSTTFTPAFRPTQGQFIPASPDPTPAPHRFDYPAVLNLERTNSGYVSSLQAV